MSERMIIDDVRDQYAGVAMAICPTSRQRSGPSRQRLAIQKTSGISYEFTR